MNITLTHDDLKEKEGVVLDALYMMSDKGEIS